MVSEKMEAYLTKLANDLGNKEVQIGWFPRAVYPTGEHVAEIALQNEVGVPSKRIPPRPFMHPTFIDKHKAWGKLIIFGIESSADVTNVLNAVGLQAAGDVRKTIAGIFSPKLSPVTIQKRLERYKNKTYVGINANGKRIKYSDVASGKVSAGSVIGLTKPLVDTAHMIGTLTHQVVK